MSGSLQVTTRSPEETQEVGRFLGETARPGDFFLLSGALGAGKTCLTQGIAWGVGVQEHARSPSFVLVTQYQGRCRVYHVDLYRLDDPREVQDLGLEEEFASGVWVVEWADKAAEVFPADHLAVLLEETGESQRLLHLQAHGPRAGQLLAHLQEAVSSRRTPLEQ